MAASSKSRNNNAPVLPLTFSFPRSISPTRRRFSHSSISQPQPSDSFSSSNFSSSSSLSSSIFNRSSSPTRVNLSPSSTLVPSFRISLNNRDKRVVSKPNLRKTCMCSPTSHPGSFRCSIHRNNANRNSSQSISCSPSRLSLRRSAMTNSLVRIGTVEGDWVTRALTALIRPSSHQQRRRFGFQPRPSRLSNMSKVTYDDG